MSRTADTAHCCTGTYLDRPSELDPLPHVEVAGQTAPLFVASEPPITVAQWQQVFDEVKRAPGARVDGEGPMLVRISVRSSDENAVYLFTQPAHPAHPAYLKAFSTSASGRPTRIVGNYAGSRTEFETFVRSFLAFTGESKK